MNQHDILTHRINLELARVYGDTRELRFPNRSVAHLKKMLANLREMPDRLHKNN